MYTNPVYTLHAGKCADDPEILADSCFDNVPGFSTAAVPVVSGEDINYYPNPMNSDALFFSGTDIEMCKKSQLQILPEKQFMIF